MLILNFSAVAEAERIIQEMKDKIDACRTLEDRAVAHLEVSRDLSKSLVDNGLEEKGFSDYRSAISKIWELPNTPVDLKGLATRLERTQHELAGLDQEYEQLKYEKQGVEEKLEMTIQSNKELLIQNEQLRKVKQELDDVSDNLDSSWQEANLHIENLEIQIKDLDEEVGNYKKRIEALVAENNFYSQENVELKSEKLVLVTEKDEVYKERIAQLESMVAELQSANQSLEWQKSQAIAMVEEKAEKAIPQASDWNINDIVKIIGTSEVVTIVDYSSDKRFGHFVCLMPDGETKKEFFTGQLRFVQSGADDIQTPQVDQLTLELGGKYNPVEPGALVEINSTEKGQDKTWNGLPAYVQEIKGEKARVALQGDYRGKWFAISCLKVLEVAPQNSEVVEVVGNAVHVPSQERAQKFIKSYRVKTTRWEDFQEIAQQDPGILIDISMSTLKNKLKVKAALPGLFGEYVWRTGKTGDLEWLKSVTFEKVATEAISKREKQGQHNELEQSLEEGALEFFRIHNSPKKLQKLKWETVREYAQGNAAKIDALIKIANASGKENSKTRFCESLENLCADYIKRTVSEESPQGDRSDLDWVPFASLVLMKLGEAVRAEENASGETALSNVNPVSMIQSEKKISDCKTVEQLEETSACNPSNIQDADDAGVIVDIYEINIERTAEFDKLNWLPSSIQDEIYTRLGRGSRPLDFEIGDKVSGVDLYSAYCSKTGVVTRLTPSLISVAWGDGRFNTHYAEELEIIPESLALQVA